MEKWYSRRRLRAAGGILIEKANHLGGCLTLIFGLGSLLTAFISWGLATALVGLTIVFVLIWMWRHWPPPFLSRAQYSGRILSQIEMRNLPPLFSVALVGPKNVGKSTLIDVLRREPLRNKETARVEGAVIEGRTEDEDILLMDAPGDRMHHQFDVARSVQCLVIVLDHHESSDVTRQNGFRLEKHKEELSILLRMVEEQKSIHTFHLLLNKADRWAEGTDDDREFLTMWFADIVRTWKERLHGRSVTESTHSNKRSEDVGRFYQRLFEIRSQYVSSRQHSGESGSVH